MLFNLWALIGKRVHRLLYIKPIFVSKLAWEKLEQEMHRLSSRTYDVNIDYKDTFIFTNDMI